MNPHAPPPISPRSLLLSVLRNRRLLLGLAAREVSGRYRGSAIGVLWALLQPILMLGLYTFVFALVLRVRWPESDTLSTAQFALILFAGLLPFNLLSEILNRAPGVVVAQAIYVKRVVFPLELLPIASAFGVLVHVALQLLVFLVALWLSAGAIQAGSLLAPLLLLPVFVLALGLAWLVAGLSVYLRDLGQIVPLLSAALIFLAPVFYPSSAVPPSMRGWIAWNPLTFPIEEIRDVVLGGKPPNAIAWLVYSAIAMLVGWLGYAAFQRLRPGWADEL